ncbi:MAG: ATP-binding protein [Patescibacteria group bacterium]
MRIHLPNGAFLGNIDQFIQDFDSTEPEKLTITAVDKWMWVHPVVLSMIASLALKIEKKNIICQQITAKSGHYLERMGLFNFLGIKSGMNIVEHESSGRFIPLTQIKNSTELTKFITDMIPLLHLMPQQAEPIRYIVSELVRNVLEHAQTKYGAIICAQYFKKSNTIRFGISDTGIGIKTSLRNFYPTEDDIEAIKLALMPGITGTTSREGGTELNAGAGLFFIKSIAYVNHNFFIIYSGTGMYKLFRKQKQEQEGDFVLHANPKLDRHSERNNLPQWDGTVIGIDISLDSTSEFNKLLDLIRNVYSRAIRERKEQKYKKQPKFT